MSESEIVQETKSEPLVAAIPETPVTPPPAAETKPTKMSGEASMEKVQAKKWAGKYDSPEALEAGYAEAQKMISQRGLTSFDDLSQRIGMSIDEMTVTYLTDGKLNIAQVEAFEKAGISKDLAARLIEGEASKVKVMQHEVEKVKTEVAAVVGGKAQQDAVLNWAAGTMVKSEIEAFNQKLNNPQTAVSAMRELSFLHTQAVGSGNTRALVQGMTPPSEVQGYGSVNEVVRAMSMVRKQGYVDESTRRRLASTPKNFMQGMNQ